MCIISIFIITVAEDLEETFCYICCKLQHDKVRSLVRNQKTGDEVGELQKSATACVCACFLIAYGMRKAVRTSQEGERARYKRHTRERIPVMRRYSFEKRPPVDKSANLASFLWRCASCNSDTDLRNSLLVPFAEVYLFHKLCSFIKTRWSLLRTIKNDYENIKNYYN